MFIKGDEFVKDVMACSKLYIYSVGVGIVGEEVFWC